MSGSETTLNFKICKKKKKKKTQQKNKKNKIK